MKKIKGAIVHPVMCSGCKYLKLTAGGVKMRGPVDMAHPPAGMRANCRASKSKKKRCENWTEDVDMVDKLHGLYDLAPNNPICDECRNFDGGKCKDVKQLPDGKWVPKKQKDACISYRNVSAPKDGPIVIQGDELDDGE